MSGAFCLQRDCRVVMGRLKGAVNSGQLPVVLVDGRTQILVLVRLRRRQPLRIT